MKTRLRSETVRQFHWYRVVLLRHLCNFDPLENLLVCGAPRSGSTWLAELVGTTPRTAILFEPLVPTEPTPFRALRFGWNQPIPEDAVWDEAKGAFERMFRGKTISEWNLAYSASSFVSFLSAKRMVVKFCHANTLLPWLTRNFAFRYAPVFLLRHPFATVASQLKHGGWRRRFKGFRMPDGPFNEHYVQHEAYLSSLQSREEALVARWCLSNLVPLRAAGTGERWLTVYYEHLLRNPEESLRRLFNQWGLPVPDGITSRIATPSTTAIEATFKHSVEEQLGKWQQFFSDSQVKRMMAVLDYFGVAEYNEGLLPAVKDPTSMNR